MTPFFTFHHHHHHAHPSFLHFLALILFSDITAKAGWLMCCGRGRHKMYSSPAYVAPHRGRENGRERLPLCAQFDWFATLSHPEWSLAAWYPPPPSARTRWRRMTIKIHFFVNLNNDHQGRQHSLSSTDGLFWGLLTQQKLLLFHLRNTQYSLNVLNKMIKLSRGRFVSSFRVPSPFFFRIPFVQSFATLCDNCVYCLLWRGDSVAS